jgi:hypothetical protein
MSPLLSPGRRAAALAVLLLVLVFHLWGASRLADTLSLGDGDAAASVRRIDVAFVRELQQAAPPQAAPAAARAAAPRRAPAARPAASAPEPAPLPPVVEPPPLPEPAPAPLPEPPLAQAPEPAVPELPPAAAEPAAAVAATTAPASAAAVPAPPPFEWPPSTRLTYKMVGFVQGDAEGSARVEWLRSGGRYQVHLDVVVGPEFAPLVTRRMSSEGQLSEQGLRPLRYEESTKLAFRSPRINQMAFGPARPREGPRSGERRRRAYGVQLHLNPRLS